MAVGDAPRCQGPVALADLFDGVLKALAPKPEAPAPAADRFLYSGNRHESVPRRLFLDRRLTPLERNAWQVFRLLLNDDGVTAFPTYEQLRPWLATIPCSAQASHETVARALTLLRLTCWLSLVRRRRDLRSGRILGNLYVLHDEPLTPFEAMQLDPDYLELVSQSLSHSAKAVQVVGLNTLQEIAADPLLSGRTLPSRLQVLAQRMVRQGDGLAESYPQEDAGHESEEGSTALLRNAVGPSSESEAGAKPTSNGSLRNPKQDRTVRKESIDEVRTTARARAPDGVEWPTRFTGLMAEQQRGVMVALQQVQPALRQAVLDEWDARCRGSSIRNPAGYLFGIIQRAIHGEFNARAAQPKAAAPMPQPPRSPKPNVVPPEVAMQHINRLRELLRKS